MQGQTLFIMAAAVGGGKDKKESIICCSCREELSSDDQALAIKCSAGHYICARDPKVADRCTTAFVRSQAETSYTPPIKCPVCPAPVVLPTFIRFLDDSQLSCHMIRVAMSTLQPGESLLECPNCRYSEICDCSIADIARLHCKFETCGSVTCYVCKLEIGKLRWDDFDEGSVSPMAGGSAESQFETRAEEHLTSCFPLASLKFRFDEVMELNSKFKCPTCNFGGQKDDACTHMKECPCAVPWCYFCQPSCLQTCSITTLIGTMKPVVAPFFLRSFTILTRRGPMTKRVACRNCIAWCVLRNCVLSPARPLPSSCLLLTYFLQEVA